MPRLPPSLLHLANTESPFLSSLLHECRDLSSSRNELRWLTEYAVAESRKLRSREQAIPTPLIKGSRGTATSWSKATPSGHVRGWRTLLKDYVRRRENGEPLQYILGSQPFGELDILCKPGVLIPRWETESYTSSIGELVRAFLGRIDEDGQGPGARKLRLLDLCTGTGCIPLAIYEMLKQGQSQMELGGGLKLEVLGVDISPTALNLARENLHHNIALGSLPKDAARDITFLRGDVLAPSNLATPDNHRKQDLPYILDALKAVHGESKLETDVLTANPPYISPTHFSSGRTTRSVRRYEPKLALVPPPSRSNPASSPSSAASEKSSVSAERGDEFYRSILPQSLTLNAGLTVLEVADTEQAGRVVELAGSVFMKGRGEGRGTAREKAEPGVVIELWYDDGRTEIWRPGEDSMSALESMGEEDVSVRAVVVWRREWADWRSRMLREGEKFS